MQEPERDRAPELEPCLSLVIRTWQGVRIEVWRDGAARAVVVVDQGERVLLAARLPSRA